MSNSRAMQIGLGDVNKGHSLNICVYIANRPPMEPYTELDYLSPVIEGEIAAIAQHTGNHWRKIFNVYAKLMFTLLLEAKRAKVQVPQLKEHVKILEQCKTWQKYRDQVLLQNDSATSLLFTPPDLTMNNTLHIIMGKGYAETLSYPCEAPYLVEQEHGDFARYEDANVIVCPYFDYRQLSNIKIDSLVSIILLLLTS